MIIRKKKTSQETSPIALLAVGGGLAAFVFWLVQRSKSDSASDKVIATSITETQTIQLPKGTSNAVAFGDIILYDYPTQDDTSMELISVGNTDLIADNDLELLGYDVQLPKLGLASDAMTSTAVAMKGFLVPSAKKLSKKGNLDLIAKCDSTSFIPSIKTVNGKRDLALIIDQITTLANNYLASDSNEATKTKLSELDKQRLAAAIMWSFVQRASSRDNLFDVWYKTTLLMPNTHIPDSSKEVPSSMSVGYVEAFLQGYFNCENAGFPEFLVLPSTGSMPLPATAIPSRYETLGSNPNKEPAYFNGVVFYAKKI